MTHLARTPPTRRQLELLRYVGTYLGINGFVPSIREIASAHDISSTNAVNDHLIAFERKGLILRQPHTARGYRLTDAAHELLAAPSPPVKEDIRLAALDAPVRVWRAGTVYVIEAVGSNRVKIGYTRKSVEERRTALQTGSPYPLVILVTFPGSPRDERGMHERFAALRVSPAVEWFELDDRLRRFIEDRRRLWAEVEE